MTHLILADMSASVSELKKDPMGTVAAGEGLPVAILNRNAPAFYCIPAKAYEAMLERLEDLELNAIANAREGQAIIGVTLDELGERVDDLPRVAQRSFRDGMQGAVRRR